MTRQPSRRARGTSQHATASRLGSVMPDRLAVCMALGMLVSVLLPMAFANEDVDAATDQVHPAECTLKAADPTSP